MGEKYHINLSNHEIYLLFKSNLRIMNMWAEKEREEVSIWEYIRVTNGTRHRYISWWISYMIMRSCISSGRYYASISSSNTKGAGNLILLLFSTLQGTNEEIAKCCSKTFIQLAIFNQHSLDKWIVGDLCNCCTEFIVFR